MAADGDTFTISGSGSSEPIYNSAGQGRRLRMYRPANVGPNVITVSGQNTILARARSAARNDPWAGTALDKLVSNEIGTGIQAKPKFGTLEQKAQYKKKWDRWCKVCDADGIFDFYGLQGLGDREWHEAGEFFVRLRQRRPQDGLEIPLQLQMIEAEQCPATYYATASNGNVIRAGIEFNSIGQRVAYWMYAQHPGDMLLTNSIFDMTLRRIPAEQIIHVYEPIRAGQLRGLPHMTSTLIEMFNLNNFKDTVLERQKIANLFTLFFTRDASASADDPLGDAKSGRTDRDDTPLAGLEPGSGVELPDGVKPEFSTPPDAGSNFAPYMRVMLMAIAARAGIPYEVLTGDLANISDRALRLILNEFRRIVEQRQWLVLIPMLCQRVREAWFDAGVLVGALDAPGYAEQRDDYVDTLWVPQGFPYSHPVQDVDADRKAVRAGFKTRSGVVLANGDDPEEVDTQIALDNARADANGFIFDSDARYVSDRGITQAKPAGSIEPETDSAAAPPEEN